MPLHQLEGPLATRLMPSGHGWPVMRKKGTGIQEPEKHSRACR